MSTTRKAFLALIAVVLLPVAAHADPIPIGDLTDGTEQISDVTGAWDLWANAGDIITVTVRRLSNFDPWAWASEGASDVPCESGTQFQSCVYGQDYGDDQLGDNGYLGGFGDPQFTFTAGMTGLFTITALPFGVIDSSSGYQYRHSVQAVGSTYSVPEPGTLGLLGIGLLGLGLARRKKA